MIRTAFVLAVCVSLAFTVCSACQPDETTAQGVARRFVDQHYVHFDLAAAQAFCSGLALRKIQDERRLTEGVSIDASTRKPTVRYRLLERQEDGEHGTFVFQGTIHVEDADTLTREWIINTRRTGGQWTVSNFSERFD